MRASTLALAATVQLAAANWTVIAPNLGTISTGSWFVNQKRGYIPICEKGVGTTVLTSNDGGKTWDNDSTEPFALLLLDIAAYKETVCVIGALSVDFSINNGKTFNASVGAFGAGQCVRPIGVKGQEIGYAAVGDWGLFTEVNGPAVSYTDGALFTPMNISDAIADSRYGAFPDNNTWYIALGEWPGEGADDDPTDDDPMDDDPPADGSKKSVKAKLVLGGKTSKPKRKHTPLAGPVHKAEVKPEHYKYPTVPVGSIFMKSQGARRHLLQAPASEGGKLFWAIVKHEAMTEANWAGRAGAPPSTWEAQITKTTDGGKTWSSVYSKVGQFYFNGIECTSTSDCCVVAESGAGQGSTGTFIFCTSDGGSSWQETLIDNDPDSSLSDIAPVSDKEFWAVGGEFGAFGPTGAHFYHTTDSGKTWTQDNSTVIADQDAIAVDCVPGTGKVAGNCWANLLEILTQESSLAALRVPSPSDE